MDNMDNDPFPPSQASSRNPATTNERRHICPTCSQSFLKSDHLARHRLVHSKIKNYTCNVCGSKHARRDTLQRHLRYHERTGKTENPTASRQIRDPILSPAPAIRNHHLGQTPSSYHTPAIPRSVSLAPTNVVAYPSPVDHNDQPGASPSASGHITNSTNDDGWLFGPEFQLQDDFDLSSINNFMNGLSAKLDGANHQHIEARSESIQRSGRDSLLRSSLHSQPQSPALHRSEGKAQWFLDLPQSRTESPAPASRASAFAQGRDADGDESMGMTLRPPPSSDALPPTDILNQYIQLYLTRFNDIFPIVHLPTFRPSTSNQVLLLSICSVGALLIGSSNAYQHGKRFFERVKRVIMDSCMVPSNLKQEDRLPQLQAAIISQTFALLSGDPLHLISAQSCNRILVNTFRHFKDSYISQTYSDLPCIASVDKQWEVWVMEQTFLRLQNAAYAHEGELAAITHDPPCLRWSSTTPVQAAPEELFLARPASNWESLRARLQHEDTLGYPADRPSILSLYAHLQTLSAAACEQHYTTTAVDTTGPITTDLINFRSTYFNLLSTSGATKIGLSSLWHASFMALSANINLLETATGRRGSDQANEARTAVTQWANSPHAHRAIFHIAFIVNTFSARRASDVPALHEARILFQAGLILYCYSTFGGQGVGLRGPERLSKDRLVEQWAEIHMMQEKGWVEERTWRELEIEYSLQRCGMQAENIIGILRGMRAWRVAHRYADTLDTVVQGV